MYIQMFNLNCQLKTMFDENGLWGGGSFLNLKQTRIQKIKGGQQDHGPKNLATLHKYQYWAILFQPAI